MTSGFVKFGCAATVFILLIAGFALKTFRDAGEFKKLVPHSLLDCRVVEGVESSEDLTVDKQTGMAFIASGIKGIGFGDSKGNGAIFSYDLNAENPRLVNLTESFKEEFHPHGLGIFTDADGGLSVFVVNHRRSDDSIEIFDYDGEKLAHRRSVSGKLMHNPNDVLPVGRDKFYATNDHGFLTFNGQLLEDFLQLSRAYVLYFDGEKFRVVAEGLSYANGINISPDGKTVYVAETVGGGIRAYDRDVETGDLTFRDSVDLNTGADNIELDEAGNLWVGAHPKLLTFTKHARDHSKPSPSQVLLIAPEGGGNYTVDEIYLEEGGTLPGSSVASPYMDKILIGGVFAPHFLVCEMEKNL